MSWPAVPIGCSPCCANGGVQGNGYGYEDVSRYGVLREILGQQLGQLRRGGLPLPVFQAMDRILNSPFHLVGRSDAVEGRRRFQADMAGRRSVGLSANNAMRGIQLRQSFDTTCAQHPAFLLATQAVKREQEIQSGTGQLPDYAFSGERGGRECLQSC